MFKFVLTVGAIALLAGCAVAPGYDYGYGGYGQPYSTGYYSGYAPTYGSVNIGVWGGGGRDYHGGDWHGGGPGGPSGHGGGHGGPWGPPGGSHGGGPGGGHGGGGHGGGGHGGGGPGGR
ncbi:MAG TPA: hypothetical protein VJU59_11025 [Paraburkholderia sp.]|uniref:hypothetical protein n=1 Tax=Paraburkholderia sp. TaxID=1926495 RepID=UPI002B49FF36|nr:hypothetical protein [Paraburkholderia sp.]HKR40191.1 hypothetical protein [Paraburkholderia sp.]